MKTLNKYQINSIDTDLLQPKEAVRKVQNNFFNLKRFQTPPVSVHNGKKLEPELRREGC